MFDMHLTLNAVALQMIIAAVLHVLLDSAARRHDRPKKRRPTKTKDKAKNRTSGPKS